MKIKHKEKNYIIETSKYETVWLTKKEMFANRYMLQCQNEKGLFMASKKLPKNKWTYSIKKDLGFDGLFSTTEHIADNFKTIDEAKKFIKNI